MRRQAAWLVAVLLAGAGVFYLKYHVQVMEMELARLNKELLANQESLHVLAAEWTYLTRPERLAKLNRRYLKLQPVTAEQITDLNNIPKDSSAAANLIKGAR